MKIGFTNLHGHTGHSHLDAIIQVDELFDRAKELGQDAIAITDHGVMGGCWEAYKAYKRTGVKYIPGNEIYFCEDLADKKAKRGHLIILASNYTGYKNLLRLTAEGYRNQINIMGREVPRVDGNILRKYNEGLFATSACMSSLLADGIFNKKEERAEELAALFKGIFGDRFYLELQPHDLRFVKRNKETKEVLKFNQLTLNNELIKIAKKLDVKMVATCDSHYLTPSHEPYHDMIQAISSKRSLEDLNRKRYAYRDPCSKCEGHGYFPIDSKTKCDECQGSGSSHPVRCAEYYLKSEEEVLDFFTKHYSADFARELVGNTAYVNSQCEPPDYIEPNGERLPVFDMKHIKDCDDMQDFLEWRKAKPQLSELPDDAAYLRFRCWKGFRAYCKGMSKEEKQKYWDTLLFEIDVLESRHFCSYMLIVSDYIRWAKDNDVYVGPGRGSASGSLVAFFLDIHEVDPIAYGLLFERFQNKFKKALPDIDTDFAPSGRERVYKYVQRKYGEEHVSYISNISRITPKVAVKDIARSLQIGGDKSAAFRLSNAVTATIPDQVTLPNGKTVEVKTIDMALQHSRDFAQFAKEYPEVIEHAKHLVGLPRNFSTHAGGVLISDVPLPEYAPLRRDKDGAVATQYDKETCEDVGLVKMDFLAIETLDIIKEAYESAQDIGIKLPKYNKVPYGDEKTFRLIQSGRVLGCFQLEGHTLAPLCKPMKPKNIEDIALINSLGRPNCKPSERQDFIARRFGKKKISYPHKLLQPILKHTLGISIYEEDLLKLAQHIAGWGLSEADDLRKLTKYKAKKPEFAAQLEKRFVEDTIKHSKLSKEDANMIWKDVVLPFSGYAFNKAHAISYSILGYRTAFYKAHAPGPFLCANLNARTRSNARNRDEKIEAVKKDIRDFGIKIRPCDVNASKEYYSVVDNKTIVTGLGAIKGLGVKALANIVAHQPYASFADFLCRVPSSSVNKTAIQALAKAGAFDSLGISRKFAFEYYGKVRDEAKAYVKKLDDSHFEGEDRSKPYEDYLEGFISSVDKLVNDEWPTKEKMVCEKEVLGEYLSGSANDLYPDFFKGGHWDLSFKSVASMPDKTPVAMEGIIVGVRELKYKKGKNAGAEFGKLTVENLRGETIDVTVWHEQYIKIRKYLKQGDTPIRGMFSVNEYQGEKSLTLNKIDSLYRKKDNS